MNKHIYLSVATALSLNAFAQPLVAQPATPKQLGSFLDQTFNRQMKSMPPISTPIIKSAVLPDGSNLKINCPAGGALVDCLPIQAMNGLRSLTPRVAMGAKQIGTLADLSGGYLKEMTVGDLPDNIIKGFNRANVNLAGADPRAKLAEVAPLGNLRAEAIPGILNTPFANYKGAVTLKQIDFDPTVNQALGLGNLSLNPTNTKRMNTVLKGETPRPKTMINTGTNRQPNYRASGKCDMVEATDGSIYYVADTRCGTDRLLGGTGLLANVEVINREPAAVSLTPHVTASITSIDARKGTALVHLNVDYCQWLAGCSAKFIQVPIGIEIKVDKTNPYYPARYI